MSDSSNRPSLAGPVMISVSILMLAGAIAYAARPRVLFKEEGLSGIMFDDGTVWQSAAADDPDYAEDEMFRWRRLVIAP